MFFADVFWVSFGFFGLGVFCFGFSGFVRLSSDVIIKLREVFETFELYGYNH